MTAVSDVVIEDSSYSCTLSHSLVERAKTELNEKPEWRLRDISSFRCMVEHERVHGLNSRLDGNFLIRFLRLKRFDYDEALRLLKAYYHVRRRYPHLYTGFTADATLPLFLNGVVGFLPHRDVLQRRILLLRPGRWMPDVSSAIEVVRACLLAMEILIESEDTQVAGVVCLCDLSNMSWTQISHFSPTLAKMFINAIQGCFPCRLKGFHVYQESKLMDILFAIVRPFISSHLVDRIHFHGQNLSKIVKAFGVDNLPSDYGGTQDPYDAARCAEEASSFGERLRMVLSFGFSNDKAPDGDALCDGCSVGAPVAASRGLWFTADCAAQPGD